MSALASSNCLLPALLTLRNSISLQDDEITIAKLDRNLLLMMRPIVIIEFVESIEGELRAASTRPGSRGQRSSMRRARRIADGTV